MASSLKERSSSPKKAFQFTELAVQFTEKSYVQGGGLLFSGLFLTNDAVCGRGGGGEDKDRGRGGGGGGCCSRGRTIRGAGGVCGLNRVYLEAGFRVLVGKNHSRSLL